MSGDTERPGPTGSVPRPRQTAARVSSEAMHNQAERHHRDSVSPEAGVSPEYLLRFTNTLLKIDDLLSNLDNLPQLLKRITEESERLVDADASSLLLYDEDSEELYFEVALGPKGDRVREIRLPVDRGICGAAACDRRPVNVPDVSADSRWQNWIDEESKYKTRCVAAVPIVHRDRLVGVLEVLNKRDGGTFTDSDIVMLEALATQAGIAIANAHLYQETLRSQRMATVGEAIAGLAHYVKNVLTGVRGCMSLLEFMIRERRYDLLPNNWEMLKRNINKVSALVLDMLAYSKEVHLVRRPTDLNALVGAACEELSGRAREMNVDLRLGLESGLPAIAADPNAVERCVFDLVTNAMDAITDARIDEPDLEGVVRVSTRRCGRNLVELEVVDTGCGVPPEIRAKIFNAFFTTKGSSGAGLGLAVTQKYVHEHGGTITVHDMVPRGSAFRIRLPIAGPEAPDSAAGI